MASDETLPLEDDLMSVQNVMVTADIAARRRSGQ
jgi:hypothetical protein